MVQVGAETLAVPVPAVKAVLHVRTEDVRGSASGESIEIDGEQVELMRLDRVLGLASRETDGLLSVVTLRTGRKSLAVVVDQFFGKQEIVVKSLGGFLQGVGPFSGATVTGEGRVILLLDALKLLELAVTAPAARAIETSREEADPAADGKRWVLLVDDSVSVRKFVGGMLERAGFRVVTARDGAEALALLAARTVDIVVTDLEMPRLNGYELIRDLNREPATCGLPIVVLTTRAGAKHASLAKSLGVEHYVAKPVDEKSFVQLIESLAVPSPAPVAG
jgi:chemosensory pili system protein ChpA (sensor histidine kinase/response regulator)